MITQIMTTLIYDGHFGPNCSQLRTIRMPSRCSMACFPSFFVLETASSLNTPNRRLPARDCCGIMSASCSTFHIGLLPSLHLLSFPNSQNWGEGQEIHSESFSKSSVLTYAIKITEKRRIKFSPRVSLLYTTSLCTQMLQLPVFVYLL